MKIWKVFLKVLLPLIHEIGEQKKAEDENTTGRDDIEGAAFVFAADLLEALATGKKLPKAPDALK